eukprot:m.231518 g.231518  ORF g.231518 m.231518 type:complete len:298 (-) comp18386_c0_seq1:49-942(-)
MNQNRVFLLLAAALLVAAEQGFDRILLRDVQTLTFFAGKFTLGRRVSPIPQLNCVSGACHAAPRVIQCKNQGHDGRDYQWKCEAELASGYQLGVTDVICEGFEHPQDPYILAGSCGLEYTIEVSAPAAHARPQYPNPPSPPAPGLHQMVPPPHYHHQASSQEQGANWGLILFIGLFAFCLFRACCPSAPDGGNMPPGGGPGFGGGPGGSDRPGFDGGSGKGGPPPGYPATQSSSGPGFYTGMAAGAAADRLFTSSTRRESPPPYTAYAAPPPTASTRSDEPSQTTHVSSGFGTTKRR